MSGYQLRMASWEHINNYDYQPESNLLIAVNGGVVSHDEVCNRIFMAIAIAIMAKGA
ncbi:hypothetical protein [Motilimonas sp. E26]|uniref:hypothetical protein n=1 Tax=Motilimonas sp. E26 TaxID=2865674 RepID=UPI001E2C9C74|nr:hypothetical protein [Motilimonas sp. E26]MCE0558994.1 hypothetical protein [Motilimonas sp. E26]